MRKGITMTIFAHQGAILERDKHLNNPGRIPFFGNNGSMEFEEDAQGMIRHVDHGGKPGRCDICSTDPERALWNRWGELMDEKDYRFMADVATPPCKAT
ncbi:MAG: hypothetical protein Q7S48_03890 [bacterium]|nr:hypothetical protein [bacterium]